ncbi:MAG TPA: hypothetical protein VF782_10410 [Allosphingosinicella sp.]
MPRALGAAASVGLRGASFAQTVRYSAGASSYLWGSALSASP